MPKKKAKEVIQDTPLKEREYLSFSSINLMITDPKKWYKEKILKIRDNEFKDYFTRGNAVHAVIEHYNNTGEINKEIAYTKIAADVKSEEERIKDVLPSDIIQKLTADVETAIDNYFSTNPERCEIAEAGVFAKLYEGLDFWFFGKIDGIGKDYIEDYKIKSSFTDTENDYKGDYEKYKRQGHFYMLALEKASHGAKKIDKFRIVEILSKTPNLMYSSKDELIAMAKAKGIDNPTGTKEAMIKEYDLKGEVVRVIEIPRDEAMIELVKKQFRAAHAMYNITKDMGPDVLLFAMDKPNV